LSNVNRSLVRLDMAARMAKFRGAMFTRSKP